MNKKQQMPHNAQVTGKYDEDRMQEFLIDAITDYSNPDKSEDQKIIYVDEEPLIM